LLANNGKAGVFGANGVLNMGGGTLSADTTLPSAAAIAMCFGRVPEKQNRYALQSFGPLSEANPRNSVHLSKARKETASSGRNDRPKSNRSKKRRSTPGSKADSDQANSRAHHNSITGF